MPKNKAAKINLEIIRKICHYKNGSGDVYQKKNHTP